MVDKLSISLQTRGFFAEALHGDMTQSKRTRVMDKFRKAKSEILIATDVAARGIDVENIDIVFNYDIPYDEEYYVHRIGRTGRAGKAGRAFTLIYPKEISLLKNIEKYTKSKIKQGSAPSAEQMQSIKTEQLLSKIKSTIRTSDLSKYENAIQSASSENCTVLNIAAALLKLKFEKSSESPKNTDGRQRDGRQRSHRPRGNRQRDSWQRDGNKQRGSGPRRRSRQGGSRNLKRSERS